MKKHSLKTKKNFLHIFKTKTKTIKVITFFGLVLVAMWLFAQLFTFAGSVVFVPFKVLDSWLTEGTGRVSVFFRDRNQLADELERLEAELLTYADEAAIIASLEDENNRLKRFSVTLASQGEQTASATDLIMAGVIGLPGDLPYDSVIIDRGREDGIQPGAIVFSGPRKAIGMVEKVMAKSSLVVLVTTPGVESTVYILGPNIYTTAVGEGGGVLRVSVPQGITLAVGQSVIVPGLSGGVFGTIGVVDKKDPVHSVQYGYVSTEQPIFSTRLVGVSPRATSPLSFAEAREVIAKAKLDIVKVPVPGDILIDASTTIITGDDKGSAEGSE